MPESLALFLAAAILATLLGWSTGFATRRAAALPLIAAAVAVLGLVALLAYSPEVTTPIAQLESISAFTQGIALTVVILAGCAAGWKIGAARR